MIDRALQLLLDPIRSQREPALWVLDEHGAGCQLTPANSAVDIISNRYDVAGAMVRQGWRARFNDFDFGPYAAGGLSAMYFRVAKERPVVNHVINAAATVLKAGGTLWLSGTKQQGIKTYAKHAAERLGGRSEIKKHGNDYLAVIHRGDTVSSETLDDKDYPALREMVDADGLSYFSKPGLYGWDKIDTGSALLAAHLNDFLAGRTPQSILDLGCGYGYLAIQGHRLLPDARIVATDNNAAAALACQRNFEAYGITGEVVADDCAEALTERFDLVLCNPPFHQGFGVERDLTEQFVGTARRLCKRGGQALFVVNAFIPIERIAQGQFKHVKVVENSGQFKVVGLSDR